MLASADVVLFGAAKGWPNAIPSLLAVLLLGAGIWIVFSAVVERAPWGLAWIVGGLWIAGAGWFADRPLQLVEWDWSTPWAPLALFYALGAVVAAKEWKYRRGWCLRLIFATTWPWLDLILSEPLILAVGAVGTAALVSCVVESVPRYQPLPEATA